MLWRACSSACGVLVSSEGIGGEGFAGDGATNVKQYLFHLFLVACRYFRKTISCFQAIQRLSTLRAVSSTPNETNCCSSAADYEGILRETSGIFRTSVRAVGMIGFTLRNSENWLSAHTSVTHCPQPLTKKPGAMGCRAGVMRCGLVVPPLLKKNWGGKPDLNRRPSEPQSDALTN